MDFGQCSDQQCSRRLQGLLPKWWRGEFSPPPRGGGGARSRKSREASLSRAHGGGFNLHKILWNLITTPSAPLRRLRDILLRSRPPLPRRGGENCGPLCLGNSPFSPRSASASGQSVPKANAG